MEVVVGLGRCVFRRIGRRRAVEVRTGVVLYHVAKEGTVGEVLVG